MTTRTISIPADFITALVAMRPVIGDASNHPGQAAAIAALDYLAKVPCDAGCRCMPCCADKYRQIIFNVESGTGSDVIDLEEFTKAAGEMARLRDRFGLPEPQSVAANHFAGKLDIRDIGAREFVMHADGTWSQK